MFNLISKIKKRIFRTEIDEIKKLKYKIYENNLYTNLLLYRLEQYHLPSHIRGNDIFIPKISIVIPSYNGSNYLNDAIDSALKQTYKNIEIIVVNDGSNDNEKTRNIALSYGERIRYFEKENGGVSTALNLGIRNMTGDYFAWLSHDDIYFPNNIEEHIKYLSRTTNKKIITFTSFNVIDENSNIILEKTFDCINSYDYKSSIIKPYSALFCGEINGCSVLIPKYVFNEIGYFDETLRISQERDMWARMMKEKYFFVNIPIITSSLRIHKKQVSKTNRDIQSETNKKIMEYIGKLTNDEMTSFEGSEYNFYQFMKYYYELHGNTELLHYINKKMELLNN
jgi:glycosyltransferase involved in cell wall biosynthesis